MGSIRNMIHHVAAVIVVINASRLAFVSHGIPTLDAFLAPHDAKYRSYGFANLRLLP